MPIRYRPRHSSLTDVAGAWIKDQRGIVCGGKITEYRVVRKVTFVLKD